MAASWNEQLSDRKVRQLLCYAALFFGFTLLYVLTAQRGVGWQDSGEFQYRILSGDYRWFSGIARAHPLYILLARSFVSFFPRELSFYAVNLFSGVGLAVAIAWAAASVFRLTRSVRALLVTATLLGFSHMPWWMATVAEVYTWSLAFLMAEIYCVVRYYEERKSGWLIVLFGLNGAHWAIHNFALIGLPVYGLMLMGSLSGTWQKRLVRLATVGVVWCLAGGLVLGQALGMLSEGVSIRETVTSVLFGDAYERQVLGLGGMNFPLWKMNMALGGLSLANPCWLFSILGLIRRRNFGERWWLVALTVLHVFFWVRYYVPDQATFLLPTLGLLSVWGGIGVASLERLTGRMFALVLAVGVVCTVCCPEVVGRAAERGWFAVRRARVVPFRDEVTYWARPWKQSEDSAERFVVAVYGVLGKGDVLLADSTTAGPLMAVREAGCRRADWRLVTPWVRLDDTELHRLLSEPERRVFVVSPMRGYMSAALEKWGTVFTPTGVVYRVQLKR